MLAPQPQGRRVWHLSQSLGLWTPAGGQVAGFASHEAPLRGELGEVAHHLASSEEYDAETRGAPPGEGGSLPLPRGAERVCFMRALKADMLLRGRR